MQPWHHRPCAVCMVGRALANRGCYCYWRGHCWAASSWCSPPLPLPAGLGFCQDLNLLSTDPADVVATCNTIYGLLLQHQKDNRFKEQLKNGGRGGWVARAGGGVAGIKIGDVGSQWQLPWQAAAASYWPRGCPAPPLPRPWFPRCRDAPHAAGRAGRREGARAAGQPGAGQGARDWGAAEQGAHWFNDVEKLCQENSTWQLGAGLHRGRRTPRFQGWLSLRPSPHSNERQGLYCRARRDSPLTSLTPVSPRAAAKSGRGGAPAGAGGRAAGGGGAAEAAGGAGAAGGAAAARGEAQGEGVRAAAGEVRSLGEESGGARGGEGRGAGLVLRFTYAGIGLYAASVCSCVRACAAH